MKEQNPNAIVVNNLHKFFELPHEQVTTVKSKVTGIFKLFQNRKVEKQKVIDGISFTVPKGEFFGIVGRNGSGKSTLLKILAGIYPPTTGKVYTQGKVVPFIELGVGFNGQLSGRANIYLNGALLGFSRKEVDERFRDIVSFAELEKYIDKKLKNYSSGMQVRLAFSVATRLAQSDILLIDEVLAVGDADFQRKCFDYFRQLKKDNKTVVLVTHDMNAVKEYCDKAILIENGKVVASGSQEKVATAYTRMFQEEASLSSHDDKKSTRWGTKRITYDTVQTNKEKYYPTDNPIVIKCVATINEPVEEAVFGISIMNSAGVHLFGTNTRLQKKPVKNLDTKKTVSIEWTLPNILNDGTYTVCPTISLPNGEVCDNWNEAKQIMVFKDNGTSFPVDPAVELSISIA